MKVEEWLGKENTLGIDIYNKKYRFNGESFDEWLDRVSGGDPLVKNLIVDKKFLFGGRILANRGTARNGRKITYSNCYVAAPPEDNIESIFDTAAKLARTFSYGGGIGVDIGRLSPAGAKINNAAKETSGAVSFMDLYSMVTQLIGQNGRRGALMISLPVTHPDLLDFIGIKSDLNRVTKANISVMITDDFMVAVRNKKKFKLSFIREETGEVIEKKVDAYEVFRKLCEENWNNAEPGMLFWDRIKHWNLLSEDESFSYSGVNPCAEEPLPAGGSCLLGSLNLAAFVDRQRRFDFEDFRTAVTIAVAGLNAVLMEGVPLHPLAEQRESVNKWRQIGLGIFGLADCLIKMGVRYGSQESIDFCDAVGLAMADEAVRTSCNIAMINAETYPAYNRDAVIQSPWFINNTTDETKTLVDMFGLANSQLLTCAPTGTLSTMLGVSGGIEPIFANYYTRKTESLHGHDQYYKVYTPIVKEYMDSFGITDDKDLPPYFVTAQELNYKDRIAMQAVWQKHIDASISSTINLPNSATVEDVENIYMLAWEKGLKGVTIFRDGCRRTGILTTENKDEEASDAKELKRGVIVSASDDLVGKKRKLMTGCGSLHCEAFFDPDTGELRETYFSKGSTGGCASFMVGLSRMISLAARGGVSLEDIVDQLGSCTSCPSYAVRRATKHDTSKGNCCPMAVGNALMEMASEMKRQIENGGRTVVVVEKNEPEKADDLCPECGGSLIHEGGCVSCKSCGYTKCD